MENILFPLETNFLYWLGCKQHPSLELCVLVRSYHTIHQEWPTMEQLVSFYHVTCDTVSLDAIRLILAFGIREYGILLSGPIIHLFYTYLMTEHRMPHYDELQMELGVSRSMVHHIDDYWKTKTSGLSKYHFPSIALTEDSETCVICQEQMMKGQDVITLPCTHTFHAQQDTCSGIETWYMKINACPLCKSSLCNTAL